MSGRSGRLAICGAPQPVRRAAALARAHPQRGDEIAAALHRLTHDDEMGRLFKVMALHAADWPEPAGFAA